MSHRDEGNVEDDQPDVSDEELKEDLALSCEALTFLCFREGGGRQTSVLDSPE